jgi:hypothetical protein
VSFNVFQDICHIASNEGCLVLQINSGAVNKNFGLELIESVLANMSAPLQEVKCTTLKLILEPSIRIDSSNETVPLDFEEAQ